jgi:hypothetical protein
MPTARQNAAAQFDVSAYLKTKLASKESLNFFGVDVPVPTDTPLGVTLQAQEAQRNPEAVSEKNVLELLAGILGEDKAEEIKAVDAGVRACGALLLWAYRNAAGDECTFPEAFEEYEENERNSREVTDEDGDEGKVKPNRATRRASGRATPNTKKSGSTSR